MAQGKEETKSVYPPCDNVSCFFVYFLSPMNFWITHAFLLHYAQSFQIPVLCMDKTESKACQIHFQMAFIFFLSPYEGKTALFSAFPSW